MQVAWNACGLLPAWYGAASSVPQWCLRGTRPPNVDCSRAVRHPLLQHGMPIVTQWNAFYGLSTCTPAAAWSGRHTERDRYGEHPCSCVLLETNRSFVRSSSAETPLGLFANHSTGSVLISGSVDMVFITPLISTAVLCLVGTAVVALPAPPAGEVDIKAAVHSPPRKRYSPSAPYWVEYFDAYASGVTGAPPVSDVSGYNVFILAFLLIEGAWDNAEGWTQLTADERSSTKADYNDAGIALMVSCFGSSDTPTTSGADPTGTANTMAAWVTEYGLDGIDVDYEDFDAFDAGTAEAWLVTFTTQLRSQLPAGDYIITHAPVAPWFSPSIWTNGGYLQVDSQVGNLIDWYNVQFYNQGSSEYTTCSGLLDSSSSTYPESALFQISANGVTLDKLVIGKPATTGDASTGYMDPSTLATCVEDAQNDGWDAGVMVWQYPDAGTSWITTVRSDSWPV